MADIHEIQMENTQCQIHKWNSEEMCLFLTNWTWTTVCATFDITYKYSSVILLSVILGAILYGAYKAYLSPVLLIRVSF